MGRNGRYECKQVLNQLDSRIGFHAGIKAELGLPQVTEGAYMDFGALLTLKGAQIDGGAAGNIKLNPYYLEIPVHIGYKYAVNDDFTLFANAGPYVAIGLFGKVKAKINGDFSDDLGFSGSASEDIFGDDGFKRFDLGLGLKVGAEFSKKYQVSFGYDFGLVEVAKSSDTKNRNFMISVGFMF